MDVKELTSEGQGQPNSDFFDFIVGNQDKGVNLSHEDWVPRFWANSSDDGDVGTADLVVLGVGVCFGAIHCITWHFSFLTHTELLIWQILSVTITAVPTYMFLIMSIGSDIIEGIGAFLIFLAGILYILGWVFTLILAFTSLRELPPGAFDTVHWTTFTPHV